MDGSIRALAVGAAFSLVAAGFAYAVPRAILTTAERAIIEEVPVEVTEPIVDDTEGVEIEPLNGTEKGGKAARGGRAGDATDNHGAAVSTGARCGVRGRAQGELSSTIAKDRGATVEEAEAACEQARSSEHGPPAAEASRGKPAPQPPPAPKPKGEPKERPTSGSSTDGDSESGGHSGGNKAPDDHPGEGSAKGRGQGLDR